MQKNYGYLLREKDIKNKLFDYDKVNFKDKSQLKGIINKQRQYSDKDIFKTLNIK